MLNENVAYLVTIIPESDTNKILFYPSYGARLIDKGDTQIVAWYDGDRERIIEVNTVIENDSEQFIFKDKNSIIITFTKFTSKLFNQFKEDVFATDFVLNYKADDDDELQLFLMTLE